MKNERLENARSSLEDKADYFEKMVCTILNLNQIKIGRSHIDFDVYNLFVAKIITQCMEYGTCRILAEVFVCWLFNFSAMKRKQKYCHFQRRLKF